MPSQIQFLKCIAEKLEEEKTLNMPITRTGKKFRKIKQDHEFFSLHIHIKKISQSHMSCVTCHM